MRVSSWCYPHRAVISCCYGPSAGKKRPFESTFRGSGGPAVKKARREHVESVNQDCMNPLLVELVVLDVLGYLNVKGLLKCRQVCKLWDIQAQKALQQKSYTVNFQTCDAISRFVYLTKNLRLPFDKFSLHDKFTPRIRTHFLNFGPQIRTLHIRINMPPKTKGLINLHNIHSVLNTTPNLENLTLRGIDISGAPFLVGSDVILPKLRKILIKSQFKHSDKIKHLPGLEENLKEALTRFFGVAPNLESLEIAVPRFHSALEISILNPISVFFKVIRLIPTLKHLTIKNKLEQTELMLLLSPKFNLESLKIGVLIRESNIDPVIPKILVNFANTIQTLNLSLNTIPVNGKFSRGRCMTLPTLPNLKHLIFDWKNQLSVGDIRQIFPKLTRLDLVDVSPLCMTDVFTELTFVEHLTISSKRVSGIGNTNINSTLTGINYPRNTVLTMAKFLSLGVSDTEVSRYEALTLLAAAPSLRNMTNLKTLEISVNSTINGRVDDSTAYFTLLRMQRLEKLIITNGNFSASCMDELKKHHRCCVVLA